VAIQGTELNPPRFHHAWTWFGGSAPHTAVVLTLPMLWVVRACQKRSRALPSGTPRDIYKQSLQFGMELAGLHTKESRSGHSAGQRSPMPRTPGDIANSVRQGRRSRGWGARSTDRLFLAGRHHPRGAGLIWPNRRPARLPLGQSSPPGLGLFLISGGVSASSPPSLMARVLAGILWLVD